MKLTPVLLTLINIQISTRSINATSHDRIKNQHGYHRLHDLPVWRNDNDVQWKLKWNQRILHYRGGSSNSNTIGNGPSGSLQVTNPTSNEAKNPDDSNNAHVNANAANAANAAIPTTTTDTASQRKSSSSKVKIQNAIERTIPAIVMLIILHQLIQHTGELGLYVLIPLLQFKMYKESTGIIEEYYANKISQKEKTNGSNSNGQRGQRGYNFDSEIYIEKWWWFLTFTLSTTGRFLCNDILNKNPLSSSNKNILFTFFDSFIQNEDQFNLIVYGMVSIGLIMAVVGMASHVDASADKFRSYLGEVASFHFALIFLVGQSSFWIQTIHYFGIAWVLYPTLLVIVNDSMAYVFGVSFGKHKLLPKLSPNKTIEGFVGAALSTIGISVPLLHFFVSYVEKHLSDDMSKNLSKEKFLLLFKEGIAGGRTKSIRRHALAMALYTSLISPFGGFLASAVKRAHFAKDFGTLIPGHGGVVDRFDCQVVTAPFVFLYLQWYQSSFLRN